MSAVKAAPADPAALLARFQSAGSKAGFRCETFGVAGGFPLIALTKRTAGRRPRIYLSAGIHGDEPAPPLTLLSLIESGDLDGPERSSRADQVPSRAASTVSVSERSGSMKSGLRPLSELSPSLPVPTRRQRTPPALAQRKSLAVSPTIHTSDSE